MNRRDFLKTGGLAALGTSAILGGGCEPSVVELADNDTADTVLDILTSRGHIITFGSRERNGKQEPFVVAVDGENHDPASDLYWIFLINGIQCRLPPYLQTIKRGDEVQVTLVNWKIQISETIR